VRPLPRLGAARAAALLGLLLCACGTTPEADPTPRPSLELRVRHLADRSAVELGCGEPVEPELRREGRTLRLTLPGCGLPARLDDVAARAAGSPLIEAIALEPQGRDLAVTLTIAAGAAEVEARARSSADPGFAAIDLAVSGDTAGREARIAEAMAGATRDDITGCALVFESLLRNQLGPAALARALRPDGGPQQALLRPGLVRLGELSPVGALWLPGPVALRADQPADLDAAATRAAEVKGLVALLRVAIADLEPAPRRDAALHALYAPHLEEEAFALVLRRSRESEAICARH